MKIKNLFFILFAIAFLLRSSFVFADIAPNLPDCTSIDTNTHQPGCGYMSISTFLDVSSYADRFVFYTIESIGQEDEGGPALAQNYKIIDITDKDSFIGGYRHGIDLFALDKSYFNNNGGVNGLFKITPNIPMYPGSTDTDTMDVSTPKDPSSFAKYSYRFVVSKDDKNFFYQDQSLVDGKYIDYDGVPDQPYLTTPNLSCDSTTCAEIITYRPQAIIENNIVVAQFNTGFNPPNAGGSDAPQTHNSTTTTVVATTTNSIDTQANNNQNQNLVLPPQSSSVVDAPRHISWWQRLWNPIVSFFKSIF